MGDEIEERKEEGEKEKEGEVAAKKILNQTLQGIRTTLRECDSKKNKNKIKSEKKTRTRTRTMRG